MKILDIIKSYTGVMTLNESDRFISEMANFLADITDLPANIVLWTKTQPDELPHNKYRMKVYKDRIHVATFSISQYPKLVWRIHRKKYFLDSFEINEIKKTISEYTSLFIQYVDDKITSDEIKQEIKRNKGLK